MLKLSHILCPVDFSEFSVRAFSYAYSLARQYAAELFVQHVTEPGLAVYENYLSAETIKEIRSQQRAELEMQMRDLVEKYTGGKVKVETFIHAGDATESILSFAEKRNIDLITMGTHGRRGLDRVLLGSTLERVLRKARCAILAVHKPVRDFVSPESFSEPVHLRRILWCTDFSDDSPRALEFALSLAFEYNADLTLLHVLETTGGAEQEARALALLEDVIPDEARSWARILPLVRPGKPYQEIIELATQAQTDLIVMGVRGRNIVDLSIFGSTTQRVIQLGPCPVLTVRS